ncbi:hypothetical protein, partial [Vibrio antiquarius]
MKVFVCPKGVSSNVIVAQLVPLYEYCDESKVILSHVSHKEILDNCVKNVQYYSGYFDLFCSLNKNGQ